MNKTHGIVHIVGAPSPSFPSLSGVTEAFRRSAGEGRQRQAERGPTICGQRGKKTPLHSDHQLIKSPWSYDFLAFVSILFKKYSTTQCTFVSPIGNWRLYATVYHVPCVVRAWQLEIVEMVCKIAQHIEMDYITCTYSIRAYQLAGLHVCVHRTCLLSRRESLAVHQVL